MTHECAAAPHEHTRLGPLQEAMHNHGRTPAASRAGVPAAGARAAAIMTGREGRGRRRGGRWRPWQRWGDVGDLVGIRSLSRARGGAFMAGGGHGVGPDGGKGGGGSNRGMVAGAPSGTDAYSRQAAGGAASGSPLPWEGRTMLPWLAGCWLWPPLRRTVPGLHFAEAHLPSERGRHSIGLLPRLVRPPGDPRSEVSPHENRGHSPSLPCGPATWLARPARLATL